MKLLRFFVLLMVVELGWATELPASSGNASAWSTVALMSLAHGDGRFVAIGSDERGAGSLVYVSDDGQTWRRAVSMPSEQLTYVTWDASRFLATAIDGTIYSSSRGIEWVAAGNVDEKYGISAVTGIVRCGDRYVLTSFAGLFRSDDLITWETVVEEPDVFPFFVVTRYPHSKEIVFANTDWEVWRASDEIRRAPLGVSKWPISAAIWSETRLLAVGLDGSIRIETDTSGGWASVFASKQSLLGIATDGNTIVTVGGNGAIYSKHGESEWSRIDSPVSIDLTDVVWGGGRFVAIGSPQSSTRLSTTADTGRDGSTVLISADGNRWAIAQVEP